VLYLTPSAQLVVPSLPAVDPFVLKTIAPPAAALGGAVALVVGVQSVARSLLTGLRKAVVLSLFASVVGAIGAHIIGLL
jgi:hypothetical protein